MDFKTTHKLWMDQAVRFSQESHSRRTKVGAVLVRDGHMISQGWNGTPPGHDNCCETKLWDTHQHEGFTDAFYRNNGYIWSEEKQDWYKLVTKPNVIHAELNCVKHCLRSGVSTNNATLYITLSPCPTCAYMLIGIGLKEIIYLDIYRDTMGIDIIKNSGLLITQFDKENWR